MARLQAELHALLRRNAQLHKQTKQCLPQSQSTQPQSQLTFKALRSNPALSAHVTEELECLGFSSSDSEEVVNPLTRGTRGKKLRLKSEKTT